jgi:uncharacterized protein
MKIEFDGAKNDRNIAERGLSFERAADFDFDTAVVGQDTRKLYPETRYVALGFLYARVHVLCFIPLVDGIRIISFRKANAREVRNYEQSRTLN